MGKQCLKCGKVSDEQVRFCGQCGSSDFRPVEKGQGNVQNIQDSPETKNKIKGWQIALIGLGVVCLLLFVMLIAVTGVNANKEEYSIQGDMFANNNVENVIQGDPAVNKGENIIQNEVSTNTQKISELSNDPYSFEVEIDGILYKFPMTFKEFTDLGWQMQEQYSGEVINEISSRSYNLARFVKEEKEMKDYGIHDPIDDVIEMSKYDY